jgi:hypothetical protein
MTRNVKSVVSLFALMILSLVGPGLAQIRPANPVDQPAQALPSTSGVNIDVPFTSDVICGFVIVVQGEKPVNFYLGTRNPWGNPVVTELFPGSNIWVITYGGPNGPCFPRNNPIFWDSTHTHFLGLHFGFYTTDPLVHLINSGTGVTATCWEIGLNGWIPGPPVTGHNLHGWRFDVLNANAAALDVRNAAFAVSPTQIPIDGLTRNDLGKLNWQSLSVRGGVPAGSNDAPGVLTIDLPSSLQDQGGWGIVAYDVADPKTGQGTTVTFEFPLP